MAGVRRLHPVAEDPAPPLPARRADELRRRALRRIQPPARGRVRLGPDGAAARRLQAQPAQLRGAPRAPPPRRDRRRADPACRPEPVSRSCPGQAPRLPHRVDRPPPRQARRRGDPAGRRPPRRDLPVDGRLRGRRRSRVTESTDRPTVEEVAREAVGWLRTGPQAARLDDPRFVLLDRPLSTPWFANALRLRLDDDEVPDVIETARRWFGARGRRSFSWL